MDPQTLTLTRLTPAQSAQAVEAHYPEWGAHTTLEEYQAIFRTRQSGEEPWGRDGRWMQWGLVRRAEAAEVLAYCCTYRRDAICTTHGPVVSYAVSAVVCPAANRKKGYTKHLMRLLHYVLAPAELLPPFPAAWGAPPADILGDAHFSILYSGIGREFYRKCMRGEGMDGWAPAGLVTRVWEVESEEDPGEQQAHDGWKWLDYEGLRGIQAEMERRIVRDVASTVSDVANTTAKAKIAVLPESTALLEFQNFSMPQRRPGSSFGLVLPAPPGGEPAFITYTYTGPTPGEYTTLSILHVSHGRDAAGGVVPFPFGAVLAAAKKEDAARVEHWGPTGGWDESTATLAEKDNQPCAVCYASEEEWVFCERYSWC